MQAPKVYTVKHCMVQYVGTHRTVFVTSKPTIARTIRSYILSTGMPSYLETIEQEDSTFLMKPKGQMRRPLNAANISIEHENIEHLISRALYANMTISVISEAELETDEFNNLTLLLTQEQRLAPSNDTANETFRDYLSLMYHADFFKLPNIN